MKFKWRVSKKEAGMGLLQFLRENCSAAPSVKAIKRAIDGKLCSVNNHIETFSSFALEEGDIVVLKEIAFEKKEGGKLKIPILFEDKELLIVAKPAGLICDPKSIQSVFGQVELIHRLDKETSGVLILAKTRLAKEKMVACFKERTIAKLYLAIVDGAIVKDEGKIDNFLGKKLKLEGQTVYGSVEEKKGQRAITHWKCLNRGKSASIVCCEPYTGRTHQLRVHLSAMGHPILGDIQYAKKFICHYRPCRNLLHAYSVAFKHPTTGKQIKVIAPIPQDFKQALEALKLSI